MDNKYENNLKIGRPENISWKSNPPKGENKAYVDYFEDCRGAGTVDYTVSWRLHGNTYSKSGSISPPPSPDTEGDEVLISTFTYKSLGHAGYASCGRDIRAVAGNGLETGYESGRPDNA
ncbi:MAG: hypothetical protein JRC60_08330 [Deltaproteobacteria bacterium]|nr:hypothetical protein [Deltaproteobacteria bacterium]